MHGLGRIALLFLLCTAAACNRSEFSAPEMQGPAAMVDDAGQPRLWLLSKVEEQRMIAVGGGGRSRRLDWRTDTFFHFEVEAIDPVETSTLWKQRILSIGDPKAAGTKPSRIIGSAVDARLLGQDGDVVWLLVGDDPYALSAADGRVLVDSAKLQELNPSLKGLLPSEARYYGFDRGLVFTSADARMFVVRGPKHEAGEYAAPPPPTEALGRLKANGQHELVPMRPLGPPATRNAMLGGAWLGLYSDKEIEDLRNDEWGRKFHHPYSVHDEGRMARRSFWRGRVVTAQKFDDKFERLTDLASVAGAPTFLKGRFFDDPKTGAALALEAPAGLLVWHSTRIDDAGRLALARLDVNLKPLWDTELPFSETDIVRRVATWQVPGHLVIVGELQSTDDGGVTHRDPYLASVALADGKLRARQLNAKP
jgi:hypothetical protein